MKRDQKNVSKSWWSCSHPRAGDLAERLKCGRQSLAQRAGCSSSQHLRVHWERPFLQRGLPWITAHSHSPSSASLVSISVAGSTSFTLSLSVPLSLFLCLSASIYLCLSASISVSLSFSLGFSKCSLVSVCMTLCVCFYLYLSFSLKACLSVCVMLCVSVSHSVFLAHMALPVHLLAYSPCLSFSVFPPHTPASRGKGSALFPLLFQSSRKGRCCPRRLFSPLTSAPWPAWV